jgi:CelD/BcsL family acetyltransferase involved in cellulose biosynthesis
MHIVEVHPCTDPLWHALLDRYGASAFHSPQWIGTLAETYGWDVRALVLVGAGGAPEAGIAFCRVSDMLGTRIVSLPFSDYCDPLVATADQWHMLSSRLLAEDRPVVVRCLHNNIPVADERFSEFKRAKWHGVDLRLDQDALWRGIHDSAKRAIKKAQRDGIEVSVAQSEDELRAFFELHLRVRKYKYRLLAQPYQFFENIWRHFVQAGNGTLLLARAERQVIGGIFFLEWRDTLYYKFNASSPDHLAYRPNDLLIWNGIQYGQAKGYAGFDFGLSDLDQESLVRFKRKFATEEKEIVFLRHTPMRAQPSLQEQQARTLLGNLTTLLVDESVPDAITEQAGAAMYRFFA